MLTGYDADPVDALTVAMRIVLERADDTWPELVRASAFTDSRSAALLVGDQRTLDELAAELNELRALGHT